LGYLFCNRTQAFEKANALILKELKTLREVPLTKTQLHNTKEQLMGQMAMSEEGNMSFMLMMAKSLLDINRIDTLEELFAQIRTVSSTQLQDLANELCREEDLSYLTFLPEN
jgi:predicted Zn-dependent peptidase